MKRIYPDFAYGPGPRDRCWWDDTCAAPDWPTLQGEETADVVVVGAGFTGMSTALHLAQEGVSVILLEAQHPGFGASGRNGGFCCLGGGVLEEPAIDRRHGDGAGAEFLRTEIDAIDLVDRLINRFDIDVDRHSNGETLLAHRASDMKALRAEAKKIEGAYVTEQQELRDQGLNGPFFGAMTVPQGFGLNPRKYLFGLAKAAAEKGVRQFANSPVLGVDGRRVVTANGQVTADRVVFATNGYSSEDVPAALAARYLPTQSTILVTRPLSDKEISDQGWSSDQMCYDTRGLLHYFRLMPDRRFLFGLRGGLRATPASEASARRRARRDFDQMFPAWKDVESTHSWSGLVCLSASGLPFVGPLPGEKHVFAGLAYHGNGVAMGSYAGFLLARLLMGEDIVPRAMRTLPRFPLGRFRRILLPPAYLARGLADLSWRS